MGGRTQEEGVEAGSAGPGAPVAECARSGPILPRDVDAQDSPARPGLDHCPPTPAAGTPGALLTLQGVLIAPRVSGVTPTKASLPRQDPVASATTEVTPQLGL